MAIAPAARGRCSRRASGSVHLDQASVAGLRIQAQVLQLGVYRGTHRRVLRQPVVRLAFLGQALGSSLARRRQRVLVAIADLQCLGWVALGGQRRQRARQGQRVLE